MVMVPTRMGCPVAFTLSISSQMAFNFSLFVLNTASCRSCLIMGLLVGMVITSML